MGLEDQLEKLLCSRWGKDVFVDVDRSINGAIRKIRAALVDNPDGPKFLETVVGKGYRFIGEVDLSPSAATAPEKSPATVGSGPVATRGSRTGRLVLLVSVALGILIVAATWGWFHWQQRTAAQHIQIHSLAVLPLANLSGDASQDYFAESMTDELITELAKIGALRVISRTSIMHYQGTATSLPQIARELRVDAVVEGTVVRSGDRLRITAQLIEASTDRHLWAESYERDIHDVLTLQRDLAEAIAQQVKVTLEPGERSRLATVSPVNPRAYEAYLRGLFFWNKWTEDGARKSVDYFQQAIQVDPNYASPYAGLANSYIQMGDFGVGLLPSREANTAAEQAALKAISLDETLPEAHAAVAMSRFRCDRDLVEFESEFNRAIELNPNAAGIHHWYSHYLLARGRVQEAKAEAERAYDLSPVDPTMGVHLQFLYYFLHDYDKVLIQGRSTLELDPNFSEPHWFMALAYEQQRMYDRATAELRMAVDLSEHRVSTLSSLGHVLAVSGDSRGAKTILSELNSLSKKRYVPSYDKALIYIGLGEKDQALAELAQAYKEGSFWVLTLQNDPRFDLLHSDAGFQGLVHRVGVAQVSIDCAVVLPSFRAGIGCESEMNKQTRSRQSGLNPDLTQIRPTLP